MTRRLLVIGYVVAALALAVTAAITGLSFQRDPNAPRYTVELDAATGLTDGGDVKIGGVRAGRIDEISLDQRTRRALVRIVLTNPGFNRLKSDAFCRVRPQSLIGEYYLDCQPGTSRAALPGNRLPVRQTAGTIGLDLLNNVMRRPQRERLRIILGELGAGVAARGPEINDAIRRAVPALRETNELLRILADENRVLARLIEDADVALAPADRRRRDLSRFVRETAEAADVSADRERQLAEQFRELPGFLREAVPTMRALGASVDAQAGAISELDRGRRRLEDLFRSTAAFTTSAVPATRSLASTGRTGRPAARAARPVLRELDKAATGLPEVSKNLAIILEHLDDRDNAVEADPRSPGGKGFTGLEALLQYARYQVLAINVFDNSGYKLKANNLENEHCADFGTAKAAKEHPECRAWLGPVQPGVNAPDPSPPPRSDAGSREARDAAVVREAVTRADRGSRRDAGGGDSAPREDAPAPSRRDGTEVPDIPLLPELPLPSLLEPNTGPAPQRGGAEGFLDFLLR